MIIAQQLRFIAIPQWLVDETGEFSQVAIVGAIQLPVQIVAVLYGGVLADRLDRRWLMAGSNVVVFALLLLLAAMATADVLQGLARLDCAGRVGRAGRVRGPGPRDDHAAGGAPALPLGRSDSRRRHPERWLDLGHCDVHCDRLGRRRHRGALGGRGRCSSFGRHADADPHAGARDRPMGRHPGQRDRGRSLRGPPSDPARPVPARLGHHGRLLLPRDSAGAGDWSVHGRGERRRRPGARQRRRIGLRDAARAVPRA